MTHSIPSKIPALRKGMLLGAASIVAMSSVLTLVANGYERAVQHDHSYQYLSEALDEKAARTSLVTFMPDAQPVGREFTNLDKEEIGIAATEAWANLSVAYKSGNKEFLEDHFDSTALKKLQDRINAPTFVPGTQAYVMLSQTAEPRFFHLDGSVFEMKSDDTLAVRLEINADGDSIKHLQVSRDCTRQIFFLQTVGWKIRNHEVDCSNRIPLTKTERNTRSLNLPLKGMNYYPATTPWDEFWSKFDEDTIENDLKLMAKLGTNSVRIFVPFEYFSDPKTRNDGLKRLEHFIYLAGKNSINVMPTLFDFRGTYAPSGWADDYRYLKDVVYVLKQYDNVSIVDLKNEPDLDYEHHGKAIVDAWLVTFSALLQELAPELSVTIGWLEHKHAIRTAKYTDVVSYHEYGDPSLAGEKYAEVQEASDGRAVLVTEIGKPSWSLAAGLPFSGSSQASFMQEAFVSLKEADGVYVWTLHDFEYADTAGIATLPWRRAFQASYGMFDLDGQAKPLAKTFRDFSLQGKWRTSDFEERINQ